MRGRKSTTVLLVALLVTSAVYAQQEVKSKELVLRVGEQKTIPARGMTNWSVGDEKVATATPFPEREELIVTGLSKGQTTLTLIMGERRKDSYVVSVWQILPDEVKGLLAGIPGIQVKQLGQRIVIDGQVLTQQDLEKVDKLAKGFPDDIISTVVWAPTDTVDQLMSDRLNEKLKDFGVQARVEREKVILSGKVRNEDEKKAVENIAKSYYDKVVSAVEVQAEPVEIDIVLARGIYGFADHLGNLNLGGLGLDTVEILATGARGSRLDWIYSARAFLASWAAGGETTQIIEYLESRNMLQVLLRPHLTTVSGKEARFQRGGEIALQSAASNVAVGQIDWKEFGLVITVTPTVKPNGRVMLSTNIELSDLVPDASRTARGALVELSKITTKNDVEMKMGDSLILSGLKEIESADTKSAMPVIGDLPVFDLFFGRKQNQQRKGDLVIFITPVQPTVETLSMEPFSRDYKSIVRKAGTPARYKDIEVDETVYGKTNQVDIIPSATQKSTTTEAGPKNEAK